MGQANLPVARASKHVKAFVLLGWVEQTTTRGRNPHIILTKAGSPATLSIPSHAGKDVKRQLLAGLISKAGVTEQEYLAAFNA